MNKSLICKSSFYMLQFLIFLRNNISFNNEQQYLIYTKKYILLKFFNKRDKNQSKFIKNLFILNLKSISIKRSSSVNDSIKSVKF